MTCYLEMALFTQKHLRRVTIWQEQTFLLREIPTALSQFEKQITYFRPKWDKTVIP